MDWIYGIHAIQTMLKSAPQWVAEIHVQSGRRDDRLQKIYNLGRTAWNSIAASHVKET